MRCLPDKTYPSYDTDTLIAFCPQIVDETEIILDPESQTYTHPDGRIANVDFINKIFFLRQL